MDYTPEEMLIAAAAREIAEGEVIFIGTPLARLVVAVAQSTHSPHAVAYDENGLVHSQGRTSTGSTLHPLGLLAQGTVGVGFIGGDAQVDRFGNLNSTYLGPYHQPTRRLAGSGPAADIASLAHRTVILMPHEQARLVPQVDYTTAPGNGTGRRWREGAGLRRDGPSAIITPLGVLRFDEQGESYLASVHPFSSIEEIRANTGWPLKVAANVLSTPTPTSEALHIIRITQERLKNRQQT